MTKKPPTRYQETPLPHHSNTISLLRLLRYATPVGRDWTKGPPTPIAFLTVINKMPPPHRAKDRQERIERPRIPPKPPVALSKRPRIAHDGIPIARTGPHTPHQDAKGGTGRRHEAKVDLPLVVDEEATELHGWEVVAERLQRRVRGGAEWGDLGRRESAGTDYLRWSC